MQHRLTFLVLLLSAQLTLVFPTHANEGEKCSLTFTVLAENSIGTINPGDRINGTMDFHVLATMPQGDDTISYTTQGTMTLGDAELGTVKGKLGRVHVVRAPYTADYISIDASDVSGSLGGVQKYFAPMLVTVYAKAGTLTTFDLPRDTQEWNVPSKRRVFQVHTLTAPDRFFGVVETLSGTCG